MPACAPMSFPLDASHWEAMTENSASLHVQGHAATGVCMPLGNRHGAHLLRPVLKEALPRPPRPPAASSALSPGAMSSASGRSLPPASLRRTIVPGGTCTDIGHACYEALLDWHAITAKHALMPAIQGPVRQYGVLHHHALIAEHAVMPANPWPCVILHRCAMTAKHAVLPTMRDSYWEHYVSKHACMQMPATAIQAPTRMSRSEPLAPCLAEPPPFAPGPAR